MDKEFELLHTTRTHVLGLLDSLSRQDALTIPPGFNNNIFWNAAHLLATQQILINKFSGIAFTMDEQFIDRYKKGTKPEGPVSDKEYDSVKSNLVKQADLLKNQYPDIAGKTFEPYLTSYGITLNSVEGSIIYNNVHETMHFGYMKALIKFIKP